MKSTDHPTRQPSTAHRPTELAVLRDRARHLNIELLRDDLPPRETLRLADALDHTEQRIRRLAGHRDDHQQLPQLPRPTVANWTSCPDCGAPTSGNGNHVCKPRAVSRATLLAAHVAAVNAERVLRRGRLGPARAWRTKLRAEAAHATIAAAGYGVAA